MQIQAYVHYEGRCEEAIEFYKKALDAKVTMLMRFKDCPEPMPGMDPANADKVMHASIKIGDSELLMSDGRCQSAPTFKGFALTLTAPNDAEAERLFAAIGDGGQVFMPLAKTFFSSRFGMLNDRFGLAWMIIVAHGARQ